MPEPAIRARDVSVQYRIRRHDGSRTLRSTLVNSLLPWRGARRNRRQTFWALKDINLAAHPGEIIGIIGPNGSGKTTLLRTLAGIIGADRGEVAVRGRVACLMGFGVGFNPDLTGRENIVLSGSLIGIARNRIDEIVEDVIELSELSDFISAPVRTYSRGMRVRNARAHIWQVRVTKCWQRATKRSARRREASSTTFGETASRSFSRAIASHWFGRPARA